MNNDEMMKIVNYDKNKFILSTKSLNEEDFEKIDNAVNFFSFEKSHNSRNVMLRNSIITLALASNKREEDFILKAIELSLIFADEAWREETMDLSTFQRAGAFSTTEDNVLMFDALVNQRRALRKKTK